MDIAITAGPAHGQPIDSAAFRSAALSKIGPSAYCALLFLLDVAGDEDHATVDLRDLGEAIGVFKQDKRRQVLDRLVMFGMLVDMSVNGHDCYVLARRHVGAPHRVRDRQPA